MIPKVQECYQNAAECTRLAEQARDERARLFFLSLQVVWVNVAQNYEFIERTQQFLSSLGQ